MNGVEIKVTIFIALIRGINVGGKNKIRMADLRCAFEEIGLIHVETYIQSGNAIFESDENEALKRFEGKIIATSGRVMEVKESENGFNIVLEAEGAILGGVNCSFKEIDPLPKVGDSIRLKGRCQGYLMSVVLNNCSLVNE